MRFLRTNTAVIITVGPFYDKTDGVTIETGLTITNERITLTADTDDGAAPTNILDNVTGATSGTSNDLNYITGNDAGMMQLELSAANVNRLGRMFLSITDAANHVPVFHEFMVVPALVYDTYFASTGGATFPAATLASTTNITAGTITTTTNLTNLPAITSNWLTAAGIAASALNGKGDWNIGKTGYALSSAGVQAIWDALTSALTTVGSIGKLLVDNINATISSRLASASYTAPLDAAGTRTAVGLASANLDTQLAAIQADTDDIQTRLPAALVGGRMDSNVGAVSGDSAAADLLEMWLDGFITGTAQSGDVTYIQLAAGESAVDDIYYGYTLRIVSGTGAGQTASITQYTGVTKNAEVFPVFGIAPDNTSVYLLIPHGAVQADVNSIRHDNQRAIDLYDLLSGYSTDGYIPASVQALAGDTVAAANLGADYDGTGYDKSTSAIGTATNVINLNGSDPATLVGDAVWDETLADHLTAGSTGNALNAAGSAGDPWSTTLPGAYGAGTAGKIVGDNLNATVSSRASQTSVDTIDDFLDTEISAIKAKTDNLPTDPADQSAVEAAITAATSPLATAANLATLTAYVDTEVAAILEDTGTTLPAQITALNNLSAAQVNAEVVDALTVDVIADSVATDGSRPTIAQALLMINRFLMERSVSSTTMTVRKEDGSTSSMTFTLNSASAPTSITRAS